MRRNLIILALIVALIGGVVGLAVTRDLRQGLDLQGGVEVTLQAQPKAGEEVTEEDLETAIEIIRSRIDEIGVSEPEIRRQGDNQIVVSLAGVFNQQQATDLIGKTARLEFYDLEGDAVNPAVDEQGLFTGAPTTDLFSVISGLQAQLDDGTPTQWYAFGPEVTIDDPETTEDDGAPGVRAVLAGPAPTEQALLDELADGLPDGGRVLGVPADRIVLRCGLDTSDICPGGGGIGFPPAEGDSWYYLFRFQPTDAERPIPELTGEELERRGTRTGTDTFGNPAVDIRFTDRGGDIFHDVTRRLAERGQFVADTNPQLGNDADSPANQHFIIALDSEIRSFPTISFRELPDGIAGGQAQITGLGDFEEAQTLAVVLQTGSLPVEFAQLSQTAVSATLGKESLREAWLAGLGGLAAVALFLILFYRFLGLIAITGLAIYGVLLFGAILVFNVTLTLPGFAGLILTIGVAADANVVIFERIKEEVRLGRSVRAAIGSGYTKGFNTIIDANVVTMIAAFVLFAVATSGVRGFALMLLLGTIISMLTAVAATRALLGVLARFRWFDNPRFMGASANQIPRWQRIDYIGKRKLWFAISGAVLVLAIVALGARGLNLGIDFKGGTQIGFTTPQPTAVDDVRATVERIAPGNPVVQGVGDGVGGRFTEFKAKTDSLSQDDQTALQNALETEFAAESSGLTNVSGSFSSQILRNAIIAIVVSLFLIAFYIAIRFRRQFALPVLIALAHDIVIALGIYALSGREMSTATVAAILTILGYSIYDTIIIFDRVRENIPIMKRSSIAQIANQSLWETIRRSLATTFITLLPIASLLVFGGATLKDFAFALLVGIASGAYSTVFIATPVLTMIMERDPEYAKLKDVSNIPTEKALDALDEAPATPAVRPPRSRRRGAGAAPLALESPGLPGGQAVLQADGPGSSPADLEGGADFGDEIDFGDDPDDAFEPGDEPGDEPGGRPGPGDGPEPTGAGDASATSPGSAEARREARRQRRRSRPHGRAR